MEYINSHSEVCRGLFVDFFVSLYQIYACYYFDWQISIFKGFLVKKRKMDKICDIILLERELLCNLSLQQYKMLRAWNDLIVLTFFFKKNTESQKKAIFKVSTYYFFLSFYSLICLLFICSWLHKIRRSKILKPDLFWKI
jgi:hypothetical protein